MMTLRMGRQNLWFPSPPAVFCQFFWGLENTAPPVNPHGFPKGFKTGVRDLPHWTKNFIALKTYNYMVPYTSPATWKQLTGSSHPSCRSSLHNTLVYSARKQEMMCMFSALRPPRPIYRCTNWEWMTQACLLVSQRLGANSEGSWIKNPYLQ